MATFRTKCWKVLRTVPGKGKGKCARMGTSAQVPCLKREVQISKALSQVLRHQAADLGLKVRSDGFCALEAVLRCRRLQQLQATPESVERIVDGGRANDKKRFDIILGKDGQSLIRAVQGHSMKIVEDKHLLCPLRANDADLPAVCVHGTFLRHLPGIWARGLIAGGEWGQEYRNHIHFAPREPGDKRIISGMRANCEIAIWIDLPRAIRAGVPFFRSQNDVILSPGIGGAISADFFARVKNLRTAKVIFDQSSPKGPVSALNHGARRMRAFNRTSGQVSDMHRGTRSMSSFRRVGNTRGFLVAPSRRRLRVLKYVGKSVRT